MTKTPCKEGRRSGGNHDRPFFVPEFTATRQEMVGRLLVDHVLSRHKALLAAKLRGTVPLSTDGVEDRLRLLEGQADEVKYHANGYPDGIKQIPKGIKEPLEKSITPFPPLILVDGAEIKARRILFSLGSPSEVDHFFQNKRYISNPTPIVIGARAIERYQDLNSQNKENQETTSPLFVAA